MPPRLAGGGLGRRAAGSARGLRRCKRSARQKMQTNGGHRVRPSTFALADGANVDHRRRAGEAVYVLAVEDDIAAPNTTW